MYNVLSLSDGSKSDDLLNSGRRTILSRNRRDINLELAHNAHVRNVKQSVPL